VVTKRLRFCAPVPHDLAVHGVYVEKAGTMQSKMHLCAVQLRASAECGQALLPFLGSTVTKRLRFCAPVPHDLAVHGVHGILENVEPHAMPPFCGWLQPRVATCVPLPHDVVQVPHAEQPV
jgi:hypothetical protein